MQDLPKLKRKFKQLSRRTAHDTSVENVHDLRVTTRRLRANLWLVPKPRRTRAIRHARKKLSQLSDALGEQRRYDVALEDAARYHVKAPGLKARQLAARLEVATALKPHGKRAKQVKTALHDLKAVSPHAFAPRLSLLQKRLAAAIRRAPRTTPARHHLRIQLKNARYILDSFGVKVAGLEPLQRKLGKWHDFVVLADLTGKGERMEAHISTAWRAVEGCLKPTLQKTILALGTLAMELT